MQYPERRVFLLSPANTGGERAKMLLRPEATFDLAVRLRSGTATLGEVYTFISGLYFRGKIAYAEAFASPPDGCPSSLVIVPGCGLLPPSTLLDVDQLRAIASVPVDPVLAPFREPLQRDARNLAECPVVLLGSIASDKYVTPLLEIVGDRLVFPEAFVGRGDMSRGGLMLRCARDRTELEYIPVLGATRNGKRPPRLPKLRP